MSAEWETLCVKFEERLTDEQLTMFNRLCNLQSATAADEARTAYKAGFKGGMALMGEVQA